MKARGYSLAREFYCVICGSKGIPIARYNGNRHEVGHLKRLYCVKCKNYTNHAECEESTKYTYQDFLQEYNSGNFNKNGERISELKK